MSAPSQDDVINNAGTGGHDPRTPGLNVIVSAWSAFQDFTGNWAGTQVQIFGDLALQFSNLSSDQ